MCKSLGSTINIGVEATTLTKRCREGTGRYAFNLLQNLAELASQHAIRVTRLCRLTKLRHCRYVAGVPEQPVRLWHDRWLKPKAYDVIHTTSYRMPLLSGPAKVATIHDIQGAVLSSIGRHPTESDTWALGVYQLIKSADHLICVSECTRRDLLAHFEFVPERVHVIHHGIDPRFAPRSQQACQQLRDRYSAGRPFLLFVGAFRPNKNIERLLQAYAISPVRHDFCLVIAGRIPPEHAVVLTELLERLGLASRVILTGYVDDDDMLVGLYAAASALLLPSTYEGFGLPILEAMATGTPVLTSTAGSCPEVAAGHALLADPYSISEMAEMLDRVVRRSPEAIAAAQAYASGKTWLATTRQTVEVYRAALAGR